MVVIPLTLMDLLLKCGGWFSSERPNGRAAQDATACAQQQRSAEPVMLTFGETVSMIALNVAVCMVFVLLVAAQFVGN
jgi:hypothetical protein